MSESDDELTYAQMERSFSKRLSVICGVLIPLNISILLDMIILMINLIYAGRLNSKDLAAVGLAQTLSYLLMLSFVYGISASLDTLMSQEYGAGNYDNCAMYFNKTEFVTIVISVLFLPVFYFSAHILIFMGVDHQVAHICQQYLLIYYVGCFMYLQCNNLKAQLRVQTIVWPSLVGSIICLVCYFAFMEGLIAIFGLSYRIIAIVNTCAFSVQFCFLLILIMCGPGEPKAKRCLRGSDLKNWGEYCKIAIPSLLLEVVEGWNFQVVTLMVATFDPIELAAQTIVANLCAVYWIFTAFGTATSLSIIIGNAMGMKKVALAKKVMREMLIIALVLSIAFSICYLSLSTTLLRIFTNDERVIEAGTPALYAMGISQFVDTINWVAIGVLKGLGKITWPPLFQFIVYYVFYQPVSYLLIHFYSLRFQTYWQILILAIGLLGVANYIYLATLNWHKVADEIEERGAKEQLIVMQRDPHLSQHLL